MSARKLILGQTVHYRPGQGDPVLTSAHGVAHTALVIVAHSDNCASLVVFYGLGDATREGVCFIAPSRLHGPNNNEWTYPEHVI